MIGRECDFAAHGITDSEWMGAGGIRGRWLLPKHNRHRLLVHRAPRQTASGGAKAMSKILPNSGESVGNNSILAALPVEERSFLRTYLQQIRFKAGHLFYEVSSPIEFVWLPLTGMICLFAVVNDGRSVVLAATGREDFVGVPLLLGEQIAPMRAVALIEGTALRLDWHELAGILSSTPQFAAALRRYSAVYLAQLVQLGACHALHKLQQRLAMWLLMVHDRSNSDSLPLTHESLCAMLGCRRSSISEALSLLQKARAVRGGRGHIRIVDRDQLVEQSCDCYASLRQRPTFMPDWRS